MYITSFFFITRIFQYWNGKSWNHLLGSLLLLLLLLLGFSFIFSRGFFLNWWRWGFFFLLFFLNCNKHTNDILGLDHAILIDVEFSKGTQCILKHLGVNLAFIVISLESRNNEVIRIISISSHLLLEHADHVLEGAGTRDLAKESIKLSLRHENTNVVKSTTEVIFVKLPILVDVHHLEAVLVHLDLLLREASFILTLAHLELLLFLWSGHNSPC